MIQSMTGHGEAVLQSGDASYALELRSLNNRFFKANIRLPEALAYLEPEVESVLRSRLGRGTITCIVKLNSAGDEGAYEINLPILQRYMHQLTHAGFLEAENGNGRLALSADVAFLLTLPGVCQPRISSEDDRARQWGTVQQLLNLGIEKLIESRKREGQLIRHDLLTQCGIIGRHAEQVRERAPQVVSEYHKRLHQRVAQLIADCAVVLNSDDVVREVAIFAERADIHEELHRLIAHVEQFRTLCDSTELVGRKLDFIAQELLREANTIGSKANDGELARHVVEMKAAIDRIKEQVQNVE